jgi:hypothetical protein
MAQAMLEATANIRWAVTTNLTPKPPLYLERGLAGLPASPRQVGEGPGVRWVVTVAERKTMKMAVGLNQAGLRRIGGIILVFENPVGNIIDKCLIFEGKMVKRGDFSLLGSIHSGMLVPSLLEGIFFNHRSFSLFAKQL